MSQAGRRSVIRTMSGRRLPARFADEATMRAALAHAPWVSFVVRLNPATVNERA